MQRASAAELLPPDNPAAWPQHPIEDMLALSHRDCFPQQAEALRPIHMMLIEYPLKLA